MRTDALQAFVAICDFGSFQAAAEALHLSQPAVSKRLASLETRLGHALFDRMGRGVALTEAGRAYLPHAREMLAVLADGTRALDNLGARVAGPLNIALSHHVGLHRMPPVLRAFVARYPDVTPRIEFMDSEAACRSVIGGECELAVITLPTTPHHLLREHAIWEDPMGVYVGAGHPLATKENISISDLGRYAPVLPPMESYTYGLVRDALAAHGVTVAPRMTSHYLETLRMLADIGLGWTVLPRSMPLDVLVQLKLPALAIHRRLGAIRHPQRSLSNAARALLGMLEASKAQAQMR